MSKIQSSQKCAGKQENLKKSESSKKAEQRSGSNKRGFGSLDERGRK